MKKELLYLLRCPRCFNNNYKVNIVSYSQTEILDGEIECHSCSLKSKINNSLVDLLFGPSIEIEKERLGTEKYFQENPQNKDDILKLPDASLPNTANFFFVLDQLDLKGNELVLDVGAGQGWAAKEFSRRGCYCVAVDISPDMLSYSNYYLDQGLYFDRVIAHMEQLPFNDASFDVVHINAALHHSSDLNASVTELGRVLKKRGRLVIVNEPIRGLIPKKSFACEARTIYDQNDHLYSMFDYKKACLNNGLLPKVFFPPSVEQILKNRASYEHKVKGEPESLNSLLKASLSRLIGFFWKNRYFRETFVRLLFYPSMIIAGLSLVLIAKKK